MLGKNGNITALGIKHKDLCPNVSRITLWYIMLLMGGKSYCKKLSKVWKYMTIQCMYLNRTCELYADKKYNKNKADQKFSQLHIYEDNLKGE